MTEHQSLSKTCHKCGEQKPLAAFGRHPRTADGLKTYCNACHGEAIAAGHRRRREAKGAMALHQHSPGSRVELYCVLEALLPFAQVEVDCLAGYVEDFPDDPEHAEDAERARRGQEAIASARRLVANKTSYMRRAQRALTGAPLTPAAAGDGTPTFQPPKPEEDSAKAGWTEERRQHHSEQMKAYWQQKRGEGAAAPAAQSPAEEDRP